MTTQPAQQKPAVTDQTKTGQPSSNSQPASQSMSLQQITFPNRKRATIITPPLEAKAADIVSALGIEQPGAVYVIIGGSDQLAPEVKAYLVQLFSRGIARAAADTGALIIDGGRDKGVMAMMGQGVADRGHKSPLVGIAPANKIVFPQGEAQVAANGQEPLEPNHSHFILTEGHEWGDEIETIYQAATILAQEKPVITILVNGDDLTKKYALQSVRRHSPIIVVSGSGGLADEITELWQTRPAFIPEAALAEIIADGKLHFFSLDGSIEGFERLLEQLSSHHLGEAKTVLELAWKKFAEYDANANRQQAVYFRMQNLALALGVLGTLLVLIEQQLQISQVFMPGIFDQSLRFIILLVPITISFLIGIGNRFNAGNKWIFSRAGAESIKKEIYRYRAHSEIYSDQETKNLSRDIKLARKLEAISQKVMQTEVNTSAIDEYAGPIPPKYGAAEGDDGLSFLTPERYLTYRLQDQLKYYRRKVGQFETRLHRLQWLIYGAGALGTLLAAIGLQLWIALTTAVVTALTTYLEYQKVEEKLMRYNSTANDLDNVESWWASLSAEAQADPANVSKLVGQTETSIHAEHAAWIQDMQDAMAELRAEQSGSEQESAEEGEGQTTEQKLIVSQR